MYQIEATNGIVELSVILSGYFMCLQTNRPDLSLIIGCYNEEEILEDNFRRLVNYLDCLKYSYELIFIEDKSVDNTKHIIERLLKEFPSKRIKTIFHEKNRGRGATIRDGLKVSEGTVAGFIDIDLEVAEWYILPCMKPILDGEYDIVIGSRVDKLQFSGYILFRYILSNIYRQLVRRVAKTKLKDTETGYKFFNRQKIMPLVEKTINDHWFWDTEIMLLAEAADLKIREIPCLFLRNQQKTSTVRVFRDSLLYLKAIVSYKLNMNKS
ncbi:MAG: glycosyltransferase family 2 protein [Candidatus Glassbacteria bacterium]